MGSGCDHLRAIQDLALHSDGACAILLERGTGRNCIVGLHLYTDGRYFRGTDDDLQPVSDDRYYWSAFTTMRAALGQAGITGNELVHVLPHHVNLPGWSRLADHALRTPGAPFHRELRAPRPRVRRRPVHQLAHRATRATGFLLPAVLQRTCRLLWRDGDPPLILNFIATRP